MFIKAVGISNNVWWFDLSKSSNILEKSTDFAVEGFTKSFSVDQIIWWFRKNHHTLSKIMSDGLIAFLMNTVIHTHETFSTNIKYCLQVTTNNCLEWVRCHWMAMKMPLIVAIELQLKCPWFRAMKLPPLKYWRLINNGHHFDKSNK